MTTERLTYSAFASHVASNATCFVCSASFERRCTSIAKLMTGSLERACILVNCENSQRVEPAFKELESYFGTGVRRFNVYASDPISTLDSLLELVQELKSVSPDNILIDISTMMRETMLMLLELLHQFYPEYDNIWLAYNPATYPVAESQGGRPWLSYGVVDVRSVLGFPGEFRLAGERHLIIVHGFEVSRADGAIAAKDPSIVSIGIGSREHSTSSESALFNRDFANDLKSKHGEGVREFEIFPDDASATAEAIINEINVTNCGKPIVCAMNTKVSTCGAAIAAWRNPTIELVYAQPALYNYHDYSIAKEEVYLFKLPSIPREN